MSRPKNSNNRINKAHLAQYTARALQQQGIKSLRKNGDNMLALSLVDAVVLGIKTNLMQGNEVEIRGLGTFKPKQYPAREAKVPNTQRKVTVSARKRVRFTASEALNNKL